MSFVFIGTNTLGGAFDGRGRGVYTLHAGEIVSVADDIPDPTWLVLSRRQPILYAACHCSVFRGELGSAIIAYDIDVSGRLSERNFRRIPNPHLTHIALDPSGRWLLAASSAGGALTVIGIDENGTLGDISTIVMPEGEPLLAAGVSPAPPFIPGTRLPARRNERTSYPHCILVEPEKGLCLAADLFQSTIHTYRFEDDSGALLSLRSIAQKIPGSGARLLALAPSGRVAYSVNEYGLSVSVYQLDPPNLEIEEVQCLSLLRDGMRPAAGWTASGIALHSNGRSLYASIRGLNEIVQLEAEPDGTLSLIGRWPCGGEFPRTVTLSPDGGELICANTHSGDVTVFDRDSSSGGLRQKYKAPVPGAAHAVYYPTGEA